MAAIDKKQVIQSNQQPSSSLINSDSGLSSDNNNNNNNNANTNESVHIKESSSIVNFNDRKNKHENDFFGGKVTQTETETQRIYRDINSEIRVGINAALEQWLLNLNNPNNPSSPSSPGGQGEREREVGVIQKGTQEDDEEEKKGVVRGMKDEDELNSHFVFISCIYDDNNPSNPAIPSNPGNPGGESSPETPFPERVSNLFQKLSTSLRAHRLTWTDIAYVHFFLPDMSLFSQANQGYLSFLPSLNPPSRATFQISDPHARLGVEITALRHPSNNPDNLDNSDNSISGTPTMKQVRARDRKVLHVQSISPWAPACIGPYSQARYV